MMNSTTLTFVGPDRTFSEPIEVPIWSMVTLVDRPGRPALYMGTPKIINYCGRYEIDGVLYPAPRMDRVPERVQSRTVVNPTISDQPRRGRELTLPLWLVIAAVVTIDILLGAVLWLAIS